jgi:hypothetical protein
MLFSISLFLAAWGELQNGQWGEKFKVFHWELGVFLSPKTLGMDGNQTLVPFVPGSSRSHQNGDAVIPLPYKFRPEPYSASDKPWTVDSF